MPWQRHHAVPWCDGRMGHGQPHYMALKEMTNGQRACPKGENELGGHSASLVCFTNVFKENVKLLKGLGKIIYSEKDEVIYLTEKMEEELIHHSNCNQIVLARRNCITFLSLYQGFKKLT